MEQQKLCKHGQNKSTRSKFRSTNYEEGDETEVLFQVADMSRKLVSVSATCEHGNRVIFGKSGGVVVVLRSVRQIPWVLRAVWLKDSDKVYQRQRRAGMAVVRKETTLLLHTSRGEQQLHCWSHTSR